MKTKFVQKAFEKSQILKNAFYDSNTDTYIIPKTLNIRIEKDKSYIIELDDSIFKDSILQYNWNNGKVPSMKYYKIDVIDIIGQTIKVIGIGYDIETKTDLNIFWNGYLSKDYIKILETL